MAKSRKRQAPARPRYASKKDAMSPIIQLGIVFFFLAAFALVYYVASNYR